MPRRRGLDHSDSDNVMAPLPRAPSLDIAARGDDEGLMSPWVISGEDGADSQEGGSCIPIDERFIDGTCLACKEVDFRSFSKYKPARAINAKGKEFSYRRTDKIFLDTRPWRRSFRRQVRHDGLS